MTGAWRRPVVRSEALYCRSAVMDFLSGLLAQRDTILKAKTAKRAVWPGGELGFGLSYLVPLIFRATLVH